MAFVNATELQTALQGLEERLTQRLQESMRQVTESQKAVLVARQLPATQQTMLEQFIPANSMVYVLLVENALLILLAGGLLWRWLRSRG